MPVTAIDKDGNLRWPEDHVGGPAKPRERAGTDAVAQPLGVNELADPLFRLRVSAADSLHVPAPRGGGGPRPLRSIPVTVIGFFGHTESLALQLLFVCSVRWVGL